MNIFYLQKYYRNPNYEDEYSISDNIDDEDSEKYIEEDIPLDEELEVSPQESDSEDSFNEFINNNNKEETMK